MPPADHFSTSYAEARAKFHDACAVAGTAPHDHRNPQSGPDGEPLFTDVAVVGRADAPAMVLVISGTHGVEGFAGSGIQTALLHGHITDRLGSDLGLVMVHALNPFGFAHLRRVNEDNVDINRNFRDHATDYPANPGYDALAGAINLRRNTRLSRAISQWRIARFRARRGAPALQAAISAGQSNHPTGLFYSGQSEVWSNQTLRWIVGTHLAHAERVVMIDLHTGLGPPGHGEIISNDRVGSRGAARVVGLWGGRAKLAAAGTSVSAAVVGTIDDALAGMLPDAEVTAATLEFGTEPLMDVFHALQAENWLHHHGGRSHRLAEAIKRRLRDAFYPADPAWQAQVFEQARTVLGQAIQGLRDS